MRTIVLFVCLCVFSSFALEQCYKRSSERNELILSPLPSEYIKTNDLPTDFDWRDQNGVSMVTLARNYRNPKYCGACWAFSATTTFADRLKIARKGSFPPIVPAPQVLINCGKNAGTCEGGDFLKAFEFITKTGIPDEGCQLYMGKQDTCDAMHTCMDCYHEGCWIQKTYNSYYGLEYGQVKGEDDMMKEIFARGPISCGMQDTDELEQYKGGIISAQPTGPLNHAVSITGWGVENGKKYWLVRNNWGTYWGENGWFKIERGTNALGIESECAWIVPDPKQHHENITNEEEAKVEVKPDFSQESCKVTSTKFERGERHSQPLPHTYINPNDLPRDFDWRSINGTNYVTWDKNQHIPQYCGSCWAQAPTSAISDRFAIMMKRKFPSVDVSPQAIVNCGPCGSCGGGNPSCVYDYMAYEGLPDHTCQEYVSEDEDCKPLGMCKSCDSTGCHQISKFKKYKVGDYGSVSGVDKIKAEIFARGPISCGIYSTKKFHTYAGGVYEEFQPFLINHSIAVYGWGYDESVDKHYWIGRNSWGTYWGEQGWFRIAQGKGSLGIETDCQWGVPELSD